MHSSDAETIAITLRRGEESQFDLEHPYLLRTQKFTTLDGGLLLLCTSDRPAALRAYLDRCSAVLEYMDGGGLHRNEQAKAPKAAFNRLGTVHKPLLVAEGHGAKAHQITAGGVHVGDVFLET